MPNLSPSLAIILKTVPDKVEGTSIVALSDSSTTRVSPSSTKSPTATDTSINSTLSSLPISGTSAICSDVVASLAATGASNTGSGAATSATTGSDSDTSTTGSAAV